MTQAALGSCYISGHWHRTLYLWTEVPWRAYSSWQRVGGSCIFHITGPPMVLSPWAQEFSHFFFQLSYSRALRSGPTAWNIWGVVLAVIGLYALRSGSDIRVIVPSWLHLGCRPYGAVFHQHCGVLCVCLHSVFDSQGPAGMAAEGHCRRLVCASAGPFACISRCLCATNTDPSYGPCFTSRT